MARLTPSIPLPRMWLPGDWGDFSPTWVDIWTFIGTIGMFLALFLLFLRFLPCINIAEVKWTKEGAHVHDDGHQSDNEITERQYCGDEAVPTAG